MTRSRFPPEARLPSEPPEEERQHREEERLQCKHRNGAGIMVKLTPLAGIASAAAASGIFMQSAVGAGSEAEGLSLERAKYWLNKPVYSNDDKKLGRVAAIQLAPHGGVDELYADLDGFLSFGTARVRVKRGQFRFDNDRVVLSLSADEAWALPRIGR